MRGGCRCRCSPSPTSMRARWAGARSAKRSTSSRAPAARGPIAADQRDTVASLLYYQRDSGRPVLSWPVSPVPSHHFDLTRRLTAAAPEPVLFVSGCWSTERLAKHYRNVEPLGRFEATQRSDTPRAATMLSSSRARLPRSVPSPDADARDESNRPVDRPRHRRCRGRRLRALARARPRVERRLLTTAPRAAGDVLDWPSRDPVRDLASWLIALVAAPAFIALVVKLILPRRPMLLPGRAIVLMIATLALGPGAVGQRHPQGQFRPAAAAVRHRIRRQEQFRPWWDMRGECGKNCSFVAGESSGAFWTMAPAARGAAALARCRLWRGARPSERRSACCACRRAGTSSPTWCSAASSFSC